LIGNAAVEVAAHDRELAASVRRNLDRVEAAFRNALAQAKTRAEISQHTDISAVARFFVAGTQGLRLIGKTTSDKEILEDIVAQIVGALEYDH
jgi:TetR/AcrR family transcriptional repressor of nem operon